MTKPLFKTKQQLENKKKSRKLVFKSVNKESTMEVQSTEEEIGKILNITLSDGEVEISNEITEKQLEDLINQLQGFKEKFERNKRKVALIQVRGEAAKTFFTSSETLKQGELVTVKFDRKEMVGEFVKYIDNPQKSPVGTAKKFRGRQKVNVETEEMKELQEEAEETAYKIQMPDVSELTDKGFTKLIVLEDDATVENLIKKGFKEGKTMLKYQKKFQDIIFSITVDRKKMKIADISTYDNNTSMFYDYQQVLLMDNENELARSIYDKVNEQFVKLQREGLIKGYTKGMYI